MSIVGTLLPGRRHRSARQDERSVIDDLAGQPAGEWPYREIPADLVTATRLAELAKFFVPQPEYHPAPGAVRETRPMPAVPGAVRAVAVDMPDLAQAPVRVATTDPAALRRAAGALRDIDFDTVDAAREVEGATYAGVRSAMTPEPPAPTFGTAPAVPAPAPSRAESFVADMRFRGGLPLFRQAARAAGWCGLDAESPRGWVRWSTEGWYARERALADAAYRAAKAQVLGEIDAIHEQTVTRLRVIGGAR